MQTKLSLGLKEYKRNIEKIILLCRQHGTKALFLTLPALFKKGMPENEEKLLWIGQIPQKDSKEPFVYLTADEMRKMLTGFNNTLLETTRENNIEVLDLDAVISPRSDSFYDDWHFNEIGSERVAESVTQHICRKNILSCADS